MAHTPFFTAFDSVSLPNGTWIKPGGEVVAYVRSTGVQNGDNSAVAAKMVLTIAAGVNLCRAGMNDVVIVLPGHTETVTTTLFTPVAGAQIIGAGMPGATNAPNITLGAAAATLALSAANMTLAGLNINSATATVTGAIVVTGAGVTLANNFISFTGALGANPGIAVTGAANFTMASNHVVCNSTDPVVEVTGAGSTNLVITDNLIRQSQATSGGACISLANTAGISGMIARNFLKMAGGVAAGNILSAVGANILATVGLFENYAVDNGAGSASLEPAVIALA